MLQASLAQSHYRDLKAGVCDLLVATEVDCAATDFYAPNRERDRRVNGTPRVGFKHGAIAETIVQACYRPRGSPVKMQAQIGVAPAFDDTDCEQQHDELPGRHSMAGANTGVDIESA